MFGISEISFDFLTAHPFLTALFLILFLLLSLYLYRTTNPPLPRRLRVLLAALRILAVLALFLALFEPVVSYKKEFEKKPALNILIDNSKSMLTSENGKTRAERIDSLLESSRFAALGDNFELRVGYFADSLREEKNPDFGDRTALGDILAALADQEMADPAKYWLLLSDGISNSGVAPSSAAGKIKAPLYSIGIGSESGGRDLAIGSIEHNQVAFTGKATEIVIHLEWSGMNNEKGTIEIKSGSRILQSRTIDLPPGELRREEKLTFIPDRPGQQTFRVSVADIDNEVSAENNQRSFSMTVLKSKMKVLLAAGYLDWEYAFMNRYLSRAANVELTTVVLRRGGGYLDAAFPSRQEDLNAYDLLILYDIDINALAARGEMVRSFLADKGGGLLVFLGENYLVSRFPRWLDNYLPFASRISGRKPQYVRFNGEPAENYLFHPAVRLADDRAGIREAWKTLPPFEMYIPIDTIMSGAEIFVSAPIGTRRAPLPLLGYRPYGAGKVLAVNAAPFWHWAFFGYGFGKDGAEYRRLLDGLVGWLGLKEESDPIRIFPDRTIYTRGEKAGFSASVYDLGFRPIGGATGFIALSSDDGKDSAVAQLVETGDGHYRAEFDILPAGKYRYTGVVEKDGRRLRESAGEIVVEPFSIEDYRRRPDFAVLTEVSQLTGGRFFALGEADSLFSALDFQAIVLTAQKEIVVWNKFWLLTVFIAALGLEWLLRKRFQLI